MDKIDFENGVTKANAETMNGFQGNVERAIEEVRSRKCYTLDSSILLNSWRTNGICEVSIGSGLVNLHLSVREGNMMDILQLPSDCTPGWTTLFPCMTTSGEVSYLTVDLNGKISCLSSLVGKSILCNVSFSV